MGNDAKRFLRAGELAERTGLTERYFQKLFASGRIDWATQPGGPSTPIVFEKGGFEAWLASGRKTTPACRTESRGSATPPSARPAGPTHP